MSSAPGDASGGFFFWLDPVRLLDRGRIPDSDAHSLMSAGRPSDYKTEFCERGHSMAAQGATDREVAEALEIDESTLYRWKHAHPEFREALRLGKDAADERVERSLYRRAVGYTFDSIKIMQFEGQPVIVPFAEHVPPDVGAAQFWLKNRRKEEWRDKQELEHTGSVTVEIVRFADPNPA